MNDYRTTGDTLALNEEDRLPWLEPAEDVMVTDTVSPMRLIGLVLLGLAVLGLVVGGIWWYQNHGLSTSGDGEFIAAPQGDYKVAPADPGARQFQGEGDASYKTSAGGEVNGKIDPSRAPEAPAVVKSGDAVANTEPAAAKPADTPAKTVAVPVKPVPAKPAPVKTAPAAATVEPETPAVAGGATVQLGAFNSTAVANTAWAGMQKRYSVLSGKKKSVMTAKVGGGTVYRLRASVSSAQEAADICAAVKAGGDNCMVVR